VPFRSSHKCATDVEHKAFGAVIGNATLTEITLGQIAIDLALYKISAQEEHLTIRKKNYLGIDVILICFAIDDPDTFSNALEKFS